MQPLADTRRGTCCSTSRAGATARPNRTVTDPARPSGIGQQPPPAPARLRSASAAAAAAAGRLEASRAEEPALRGGRVPRRRVQPPPHCVSDGESVPRPPPPARPRPPAAGGERLATRRRRARRWRGGGSTPLSPPAQGGCAAATDLSRPVVTRTHRRLGY